MERSDHRRLPRAQGPDHGGSPGRREPAADDLDRRDLGRASDRPLGYSRDGDRYVVVGSNSGLPQQPGWLANIRANPVVTVEVGEETFQARATITSGAERERLWAAHVAAIPHFATYETMTERELRVIAIERVAAAGA